MYVFLSLQHNRLVPDTKNKRMKAIKVLIDETGVPKKARFISRMNTDENIAVMEVARRELCIAAINEADMARARSMIAECFDKYDIETVK